MFRMTKPLMAAVAVLLLATPFSYAGGSSEKTAAPAAQTAAPSVPAAPFFTGDGGRGMRLAVLEPTGSGLPTNEQWVLSQVQGSITADFNRFSAITIIDRQNLEKILAEQAQSLSGNYSEQDYVRLGNLTNARLILTGAIRKTANNYMLELAVTDAESGVRRASYPPKAVSLMALENNAAAKEATADMLKQLGVNLTAAALQELQTVEDNTAKIQAENALAKGIAAQRQGTEIEALSYFFQAAIFDPTLAEAANRSSVLAANISSGNIGEDVRNEITWRRNWIARIAETEQYFNNYFDTFFKTASTPYTLFYTTDIEQGAINFQNETLPLSIETRLDASSEWLGSVETVLRSMQSSIQAVENGLTATKRTTAWGLDKWPEQSGFNLKPFGKQDKNFTVIIELVNSKNQVLGRQTLQTSGSYEIAAPMPGATTSISVSADDRKTVTFAGVKADDITDNLTIRIASVNGVNAETAAKNGVLQIRPTATAASGLIVKNGIITGYQKTGGALVIPETLDGRPITAIGEQAFYKKQLTSVTIPNSVTSIGEYAFCDNQLTSVTIPNSVTTIGVGAFMENELTSVTIPNSVTSIGYATFAKNQLTSVTIPNSVTSIEWYAFAGNQLTSITIPNSVTRIETFAFESNQLTSVTIPNSVTYIGYKAFRSNQLKTVMVPKSVKLSGKAFDSGVRITRSSAPAPAPVAPTPVATTPAIATAPAAPARDFRYTESNGSITITEYAGSSRDVVIPDRINGLPVVAIGENAFGSKQLTSVVIPNSVTSIGERAFAGNQLTSVVIPNSVTSIGEGAFYGNQLTSVVIPNSVTSIGAGAFEENQLTSVVIPNSVTSIGWSAFAVNQLTSVVIPNSVTSIGDAAFSGNQLTSVVIPNSVTSIGWYAFYDNQLTSVIIPNSVTFIGVCAFSNNQLTSVIVPKSVKKFNKKAFDSRVRITRK